MEEGERSALAELVTTIGDLQEGVTTPDGVYDRAEEVGGDLGTVLAAIASYHEQAR